MLGVTSVVRTPAKAYLGESIERRIPDTSTGRAVPAERVSRGI
jgi:hypothetical protein